MAKKKATKKKSSGLSKALDLSDDLADFMGKDRASRPEINKKIWAYIKKHKLQVPNDKRMIEPDEVLEPILGSRPLSMFDMATKISDHVSDPS